MNKINSVIFLTVFWVTISSCEKKVDYSQTGEVIYLSQEIKDYFNYKQGSFWICRDSLTSDIDSFVVISYEDVIARSGNPNHEEVGMLIREYSVGRVPMDSSTWTIGLSYNNAALMSYRPNSEQPISNYLGWNMTSISDAVNYREECRDTIKSGCYFLPALSLPGGTYSDIYASYDAHAVDSCHSFFRDDIYFFNKTAGIVKITQKNSYTTRVWELQRYYINR